MAGTRAGSNWGEGTDWQTVCRRNAGRRRHNAVRGFLRDHRRLRVAGLLAEYGLLTRGVRARIARELGVHRSVITRDVQHLLKEAAPCRHCGALLARPPDDGSDVAGTPEHF